MQFLTEAWIEAGLKVKMKVPWQMIEELWTKAITEENKTAEGNAVGG